ncbi:hypothetical protein WHR41_05833 [Cladosporium halotolerans]|uniref:Formamidopyrimidine-DNA glycosylase catalytic domain-containing protein n=1 Tax=Cladosporium halotolerans TaxID=1052096 RepID=A0AB34KNB6_9PEZI
MPEIGEVARVLHHLRRHTLHRTIATCTAHDDPIVYGKVGTSAAAFQSAVSGRTITGAGQQGKYFYLTFDRPPHAVMHLGMTGWVKVSSEETGYYRSKKEKEMEEKGEAGEWPPKYCKFVLGFEKEEEGEGQGREAVEVAFVDPRRLARIRLVECAEGEVRNVSPLKENGPDPVVDGEVFTVGFLGALMGRKKVPVKALLLDQGNISGIGNWVADEVLYQARIHPEQYSNTFDEEQIKRLHEAIVYVCTTACETLADSEKFPETWLMKYRWDKGKKDGNVLPNGEKIVHLKVGGRTSAIVPSVQKKTAAVAGDVSSAEVSETEKPAKGRKRKVKAEEEDEEEEEEQKPAGKKTTARGKGKVNGVKAEQTEEDADGGAEQKPKKTKAAAKKAEKPATPGSRRSTRTKA